MTDFEIIDERIENDDWVLSCEISDEFQGEIKKLFGWKNLTEKRFSNLVEMALLYYIEKYKPKGE